MSMQSPPAQNAFSPAPWMTTQLMLGSFFHWFNFSLRLLTMARLTAFRRFSMERVAIPIDDADGEGISW